MPGPALDDLPGYRRRLRVTPGEGWIRSELEDDFHCMAVTLRHREGVVTAVEPEMDRAPWTTCPGAREQLAQTFTGVPLAEVATRGGKSDNCTHLYDLALLAAAHAADRAPLVYDILVSDPIDGRRRLELRRNGEAVMSWIEDRGRLVAPAALAGATLTTLRPYIDGLAPGEQAEARLLRWAAMVAHGRTIPLQDQSDARRMPPTCFTFQPERAAQAVRVGEIREFSAGAARPLDRRDAAAREAEGRPDDKTTKRSQGGRTCK